VGIILIDFAPFLPEYIPLPFFHSTNSFATNSGRASWFHEKLKKCSLLKSRFKEQYHRRLGRLLLASGAVVAVKKPL
jgi:hypothetical protein